jgi:UDP-glucose 4-epimerase
MRCLITGGAGFIGSHLTERLLREGYNVTIVDDLSSGSMSNIAHLEHKAGFQCFIDTILNRPLLSQLIDDCDVVFHLAAAVGVKLIVESSVRTVETNIKGTQAVLECANEKKRKVILASTSEVYGKTTKVPFSEDDDIVLGPSSKSRWSYACSKAVDEFLGLAYCREFALPTVVARLFNTIGPRQIGRYGMVVPRFMRQALENKPLTIYGDGEQSRCFTYVSDAVEWLLRLALSDEAVGEVFNVGNPQEVTINELARRVIAITGGKGKIAYIPYEEAYRKGFEDIARRVPDISKVQKITDYSPLVDLDEALQLIRDWFVDVPNARVAFEYFSSDSPLG